MENCKEHIKKQECSTIGYILSARYHTKGSLSRGFMSSGLCPRGSLFRGSLFRGVGCLSRGISVRGISVQGVSVHRSLSRGISVQGGLCPGGSLSKGVSVQGVYIQRGLCPRGSLSKGFFVQVGSLSRGSLLWALCLGESLSRETPSSLWTEWHTCVKHYLGPNVVLQVVIKKQVRGSNMVELTSGVISTEALMDCLTELTTSAKDCVEYISRRRTPSS